MGGGRASKRGVVAPVVAALAHSSVRWGGVPTEGVEAVPSAVGEGGRNCNREQVRGPVLEGSIEL